MTTFGWPEALFLFRAAGWTLLLTAIAFLIGGLLGGVLAIMRLSRIRIVRRIAWLHVMPME